MSSVHFAMIFKPDLRMLTLAKYFFFLGGGGWGGKGEELVFVFLGPKDLIAVSGVCYSW